MESYWNDYNQIKDCLDPIDNNDKCCDDMDTLFDPVMGTYCVNCYSLVNELLIEPDYLEYQTVPKNREYKFRAFLNKLVLPWHIRHTLLDLFPKLENHYKTTNRVNFVHLGQLVIELLRVLNVPELSVDVKGLKTNIRALQVRKFVKDALNIQGTITNVHGHLTNLDYISPVGSDCHSSVKNPDQFHVYTDFTG